jgi:hypothetical protein
MGALRELSGSSSQLRIYYVLLCQLARFRSIAKSSTTNECTLRPSRFDARVDALAQHRRYRPIEGVQGFTRSHWTPLSGLYSLRIAPDGQGGQMQKKNDEKVPYLSAVSLTLSVRRYVTKRIDRRRRSRAIPEATGRRLQASIAADISKPDIFFRDFSSFFIVDPLFSRSR